MKSKNIWGNKLSKLWQDRCREGASGTGVA
uniref:Uncharacterized protein n=1 Tax=viral metagenome TaxID=1070528 RepID=A0A6C0H5X3_9ZZZZ